MLLAFFLIAITAFIIAIPVTVVALGVRKLHQLRVQKAQR